MQVDKRSEKEVFEMKLVYICSPLRGEPEKNIAKANEYAREEAMKGNCAIHHIVFSHSF